MAKDELSTEALLFDWLAKYCADLSSDRNVLRIQRAEPRFQTRNYFARYKVVTARLDGSGQNPADLECVVVEVSATDQSAEATETFCDSIGDLV